MITISRKHEFDYGHRVLGHGGRCRNLHGHHGVAEVTVRASDPKSIGMVIDFSVVKPLVGKWIDDNWSHTLLLNPADPQLLHLSETEERPPYIMKYGNPTAENMAHELFDKARQLLISIHLDLEIVSVRLWENVSYHAVYSE